MHGPNVAILIAKRMFSIEFPEGSSLTDRVRLLTNKDRLKAANQKAIDHVGQDIALAKMVVLNPFGDDDEAIAGEILRTIEDQDRARRSQG